MFIKVEAMQMCGGETKRKRKSFKAVICVFCNLLGSIKAFFFALLSKAFIKNIQDTSELREKYTFYWETQ